MNFLVELNKDLSKGINTTFPLKGENTTFNGLNKIIFEYLNFRPFLEELSDKTKLIFKHIENHYNANIADGQYGITYIVRSNTCWEMNREHSPLRASLFYIFRNRMKMFNIKNYYNAYEFSMGYMNY